MVRCLRVRDGQQGEVGLGHCWEIAAQLPGLARNRICRVGFAGR